MSAALTLRRMRPGEELRLWEVLRASVLKGTAGEYSKAQRRAWAPDKPPVDWGARLGGEHCFVAEAEGRILGFLSATPDGLLDLAYILPDMIGRGIGTQLLQRVEAEMRMSDVEVMTCSASAAARRFLERRGWEVVKEETVLRNGERFPRTRMTRQLAKD